MPALRFGGAERTVVDIINHADPNRFHFSILVFFDDIPMRDEIIRDDVDVIVVPKRGKLSLGLVFRLMKALKRLRPDIVHTHLFGGDVWGRLAARECHIPMVTTEHNINVEEGKIKHWIKRKMAGYSRAYAACSRAVAEYAMREYRVPRARIRIIRPGIELSRFAGIPAPSFDRRPLRFLLLGRLATQKGHRLAVHALSRFPKAEWRLAIVGDGEEWTALDFLIRRLRLCEVVTLSPGTHDVQGAYGKSDIILVPSLWEGLGIVAMEGMAAGRLVVGAKTGGLPEVIAHKKTGLLFAAGDVDALAGALRYVFGHARACRAIAEVGRDHATERFGVQAMARHYASLYDDVL